MASSGVFGNTSPEPPSASAVRLVEALCLLRLCACLGFWDLEPWNSKADFMNLLEEASNHNPVEVKGGLEGCPHKF